jgi:hypothetical protein
MLVATCHCRALVSRETSEDCNDPTSFRFYYQRGVTKTNKRLSLTFRPSIDPMHAGKMSGCPAKCSSGFGGALRKAPLALICRKVQS